MKFEGNSATEYEGIRGIFAESDKIILRVLDSVGLAGKDVLDFGCGDGVLSPRIKQLGAAKVVGADISADMIQMATEKYSQAGVEFITLEGDKLPFGDGTFDVVLSNFVINLCTNSAQVFGELSRILRGGGYAVCIFDLTDFEPGFEYLANKPWDIRLGSGDQTMVVHTLMKSEPEIKKEIKDANFVVISESDIPNHPATVEDTFEFKDKVKKRPMIFVLKKSQQ